MVLECGPRRRSKITLSQNFDGINKTSQHALRRNVCTGVAWTTLHFPMNCAIILAGTAAASIVTTEDHIITTEPSHKLLERAAGAGAEKQLERNIGGTNSSWIAVRWDL